MRCVCVAAFASWKRWQRSLNAMCRSCIGRWVMLLCFPIAAQGKSFFFPFPPQVFISS